MRFLRLKNALAFSTGATAAINVGCLSQPSKLRRNTSSYPGALLRHMYTPKPTTHEPGSYIINPSTAAADPHYHNNTVKYLLKRVYGDTAATNALHFSEDKLDKLPNVNFTIDSPYFEKTNSIGGGVGRWIHLQTYKGEALLWDPSTDDIVAPLNNDVPPGTYRSDLISSCFGFDSVSEDFKLIKFMTNRILIEEESDHVMQAVLYSLKGDSWKDITEAAANADVYYSPAAYVNGVCYWAGTRSITSFDFSDECFSNIALPIKEVTHACKVVEVEGKLGVIVYPKSGEDKCFELWVREVEVEVEVEVESRWAKKWSVDVCGADLPLGLSTNGEILFVQAVDQEVLECDVAAKEVKKTGIHGLLWKMALIPMPYAASLEPNADGKAVKFKAKMFVVKQDEDCLFASAHKWKITYEGGFGFSFGRI